jgi:hypothetical protein
VHEYHYQANKDEIRVEMGKERNLKAYWMFQMVVEPVLLPSDEPVNETTAEKKETNATAPKLMCFLMFFFYQIIFIFF